MTTDILELPIIIDTVFPDKKNIPIIIDEPRILIPGTIPAKRFGIVDLWNIRKKGRFFSIYGKYF